MEEELQMLEIKHFRIKIILKSIEISKTVKIHQSGGFIFMKSKNVHHFKARI